jgi:hypothetical protein
MKNSPNQQVWCEILHIETKRGAHDIVDARGTSTIITFEPLMTALMHQVASSFTKRNEDVSCKCRLVLSFALPRPAGNYRRASGPIQ